MAQNPFSQKSTDIYYDPYTPGGYEKAKLRKLLIAAIIVFVLICSAVALSLYLSQPDAATKSATAAARTQLPNAQVDSLKVADGYALGTVSDPTATGQTQAGSLFVFKVNKDGSMTWLASGSSFSTIYLLQLGLSLQIQADLTDKTLDQAKQDLAGTCDYSGGNAPGYIGFTGSFDPDGGQIDPVTLDSLEQALTDVISAKNSASKGDKIVCINAVRKGSGIKNGAYIIPMQYITSSGEITDHTLTYTIESGYRRTFTVDGDKL